MELKGVHQAQLRGNMICGASYLFSAKDFCLILAIESFTSCEELRTLQNPAHTVVDIHLFYSCSNGKGHVIKDPPFAGNQALIKRSALITATYYFTPREHLWGAKTGSAIGLKGNPPSESGETHMYHPSGK